MEVERKRADYGVVLDDEGGVDAGIGELLRELRHDLLDEHLALAPAGLKLLREVLVGVRLELP